MTSKLRFNLHKLLRRLLQFAPSFSLRSRKQTVSWFTSSPSGAFYEKLDRPIASNIPSGIIDLRNPIPRLTVKTTKSSRSITLSWDRLSRRFNWLIIAVLALTIILPVTDAALTHERYDLKTDSSNLLGSTSPGLASKISYDSGKQLYQYNKDAKKSASTADQKQVGGGQGYSADLAADPTKGITIYDNTNNLSIGFTPQFTTLEAKQKVNRLVYPINSGPSQMIYTAKSNGLKEDLVLQQPRGDSASFKYKLNINSDLSAKILDNGAVGIYSADPTLFGNISFGSDADRAKVDAARKNGQKNYLAFYIPAPVIKQTGKGSGSPTAKFALDGNILTVTATGLKTASYPLSIDPSFIVTSANDFRNGNNEGIDFDDTNNQILRPGLTGGTVAAFASGNSVNTPTARMGHTTIAYNGYMYLIGGITTGTTTTSSVQYAPINSNGTVGSWASTTSLTGTRVFHSSVVYDGYIYVLGGCQSFGSGWFCAQSPPLSDVNYAKINADGTLGAWTSTTAFGNGRMSHSSVVYNGYIYVIAGNDGAHRSDIQYAPIKADGSVGTWTTSATALGTGRWGQAATVYNGYLYVLGGCSASNCSTFLNDVQYAPIKSNGDIGSFKSTTTFTTPRYGHIAMAASGYLYVGGGCSASALGLGDCSTLIGDIQYAQINADGSIGNWQFTSNYTSRMFQTGAFYNGYLYVLAGCNNATSTGCSSVLADTQYAKIDPAGVLNPFITTSNMATSRIYHSIVANNGYIYAISGCTAADAVNGSPETCGTATASVEYATISSTGAITWNGTTTALPLGLWGHAATIYNGYVYVTGGCQVALAGACTAFTQTYFAPINANGTLGSWTTDLDAYTARRDFGFTPYNGYLYMVGGYNGTAGITSVQKSQIQSDGSPGAWSSETALPNARGFMTAVAYNGFIYTAGGSAGVGSGDYDTILYIAINTNGTLGGSWTTNTVKLSAVTIMAQMGVYNGYLYAFMGIAEFGRIQSDGSVLTGTGASSGVLTSSSTSAGVFGQTVTIANGNMYLIGVCSGASGPHCTLMGTASVYATINNGGSGAAGTWTAGTTLSTAGTRGASVALNGYLYITGGWNTSATAIATVQYAAINPDGSLGTWAATSSLPSARALHTAVALNGYLYVIGGNVAGDTTSVLYAKPNADGTIPASGSGSWTSTTAHLTPARETFAAAAGNGYIYIAGGCNGCSNTVGPFADVQYAKPNADGTIPASGGGTWTATTSLSAGVDNEAATIYNGYLYVVGGCSAHQLVLSACVTYLSTVQYAKLANGGGLASDAGCGSAWCTTSPFAIARTFHAAAALNGYLYIWGGYNGNALSDTQSAAIAPNGTLGNWSTSTSSVNGHGFGQTWALANGRMFIAGGSTSPSTSEYATINVIPRIGHYSRLLDSDVDLAPTKLVANGTAGGTGSVVSLSYQTALSSGAALGNSQTISPITLGAVTSTLSTVSGGVARYYWLNFTLDDSLSAVFPDTTSTATTLTDFTLYYHPAPSKRLRGGKTFTGQTQQSLDASP